MRARVSSSKGRFRAELRVDLAEEKLLALMGLGGLGVAGVTGVIVVFSEVPITRGRVGLDSGDDVVDAEAEIVEVTGSLGALRKGLKSQEGANLDPNVELDSRGRRLGAFAEFVDDDWLERTDRMED